MRKILAHRLKGSTFNVQRSTFNVWRLAFGGDVTGAPKLAVPNESRIHYFDSLSQTEAQNCARRTANGERQTLALQAFRHFCGLAPLEPTQIQRFGERECDRILFMFDRNATIAP
jgi:hypothetical protein